MRPSPKMDAEEERDCEVFLCLGESDPEQVCGTDGVTYENKCSLQKTKCEGTNVAIFSHSHCSADPCLNNCSSASLPVCKHNY